MAQGFPKKVVTQAQYVREWHETLRQGWRDARAGRGFHAEYECANLRGQSAYERGRLLGIIIGGNCTVPKMVRGLKRHGDRKHERRLIR